eukprot:scaffold104367_cov28-Tisochrysis_lutea.AAC.1
MCITGERHAAARQRREAAARQRAGREAAGRGGSGGEEAAAEERGSGGERLRGSGGAGNPQGYAPDAIDVHPMRKVESCYAHAGRPRAVNVNGKDEIAHIGTSRPN